jgi:hypothetical protein
MERLDVGYIWERGLKGILIQGLQRKRRQKSKSALVDTPRVSGACQLAPELLQSTAHVHTHTQKHAHTHTHTHTHASTHMQAHAHTQAYTNKSMHTHVHTQKHTHTQAHTHT